MATDEVPDALRLALDRLAGEGVEELLLEAHADARQAVKARLQRELERALLAKATAALTPADAGSGIWVYCVAGDDHAGIDPSRPGVSDDGAPQQLRAAGLSAIVSAVPLGEYGEEPLKRNLNDLAWLEAMARRHEAVIETALAGGAVVPMRVCTIYRGEEQVRSLLAERRDAFEAALRRLAGRAEWGVKLIASRGPADAPADGGYLERKQQQRRDRQRADAMLDETVRECHARLEEWATASELLPPQRRELADYEGEMVLNGAYLVDDERADAFHAVIAELEQQYADAGVRFDVTGPWPAYHFVAGLQSLEEPVS